jgi:hypothetical protein
VRLLAGKYPRDELPLLTGMAPSVIDQYVTLIDEHHLDTTEAQPHAALSS